VWGSEFRGVSSTRVGVTGDGGGGQLTLANISLRREGRPLPNKTAGVYDKVGADEDGVVGKQRRRIPTTRPLFLPLHTPFLLLVLVATTLVHQIREDAGKTCSPTYSSHVYIKWE